ncbi:MAG: hypothetical protein GIX03_08180 [Candidatus Eremiobacteraeota bacterium]|nr:hypothetical protein [Candidatus Eremiobacteraeota bacterium]MBC5802963.1 hypothetical protein [Candidatus Eremiobacteraeota bacterium]MBC5822303.1 hypothetical protein [Candidatus Eremiobacteraeota bacterium]
MRVFFATGEASGDMLAAALAGAMREFEPDVGLRGIGGERMRAAGFTLTTRTTGWASLGPLAALRRIPPLLLNMLRHALWLRLQPVDLVVLIDFGAYNLRFARTLRALGYRRPILYFFPPGAWLDRVRQARAVATSTVPLVPFAHQRDFFRSLGYDAAYVGHPLASLVQARPPRAPAPSDGGVVALLPGSRRGEIESHLPRLLDAALLLAKRRPSARFIVSVASDEAAGYAAPILRAQQYARVAARSVNGAEAAFDLADAAWVASGTAVLEATLREVPTVALYVLAPAQAAIARRVWLNEHPYITLPNILLEREVVPELLQDDATPLRLCAAVDRLLADPLAQREAMRTVRAALGPPDALRRCAAFATALGRCA